MSATKGYFSLVQYCPDIARREAANVGVVLFCPEQQFLRAKLINNNHRIRRFFGEEADNYRHLNAMKNALAQRLQLEQADFKTLDDLQLFVATRANKIVLTNPKPIKVLEPIKDLEALYKELVLEPTKPLSIQTEFPLRKRLDDVLAAQDVRRYLRTQIKVRVASLKEEIEIPYGYQNSRFNLIQPIEFTQHSEARVRTAACKTAMEGLSLYRYGDPQLGSLQLVVVADFIDTEPEMSSLVRDIFREGSVEMFTADNLSELKKEIIAHGKPRPDGDLFDRP